MMLNQNQHVLPHLMLPPQNNLQDPLPNPLPLVAPQTLLLLLINLPNLPVVNHLNLLLINLPNLLPVVNLPNLLLINLPSLPVVNHLKLLVVTYGAVAAPTVATHGAVTHKAVATLGAVTPQMVETHGDNLLINLPNLPNSLNLLNLLKMSLLAGMTVAGTATGLYETLKTEIEEI